MLGMQLLFVAAIGATTGCSHTTPLLLEKPRPIVLDTLYGRAADPRDSHAPLFYCSAKGPFSCPVPTRKTAYVAPPQPAFDPNAYIKGAVANLAQPAGQVTAKPPVVFANILFGFDQFALTAETRSQLTGFLPNLKGKNVSVQGYTDSVGTEDYNLHLAAKRAAAVRDFLISGGLAAASIEPAAKGDCCFVASNGSDDGRQKNRRVEIHLVP